MRAHEAARRAAAGGLGGAASFSYETGPDGKRYAVGGEVPVSLRSGRTPEETIANAQTVRSAALAPADPWPRTWPSRRRPARWRRRRGSRLPRIGLGQVRCDQRWPSVRRAAKHGRGTQRERGPPGQPRAVTASDALRSEGGAGDAAAVGQASSNPIPSVDDGGDRDPLMVFSTLKSERSSTSGAFSGTCTARVTAAPSVRARPRATLESRV